MDQQQLIAQRRAWFRHFPEGVLEFVGVGRMIVLLLVICLAAIFSAQLPALVTAVVALLWVDHLMLLWWGIQMVTDLDDLLLPADNRRPLRPGRRARTFLIAALPSIAAFLLLAPWLNFTGLNADQRALAGRILEPALLAVYVLLLVIAVRTLSAVDFGPPVWRILFFVPLLHWFAALRLTACWQARLIERARSRGCDPGEDAADALARTVADVFWFLTIPPWLYIIAVGSWRGEPPTGTSVVITQMCGTLGLIAFFIAQVAAMEHVQKKLVTILRRL